MPCNTPFNAKTPATNIRELMARAKATGAEFGASNDVAQAAADAVQQARTALALAEATSASAEATCAKLEVIDGAAQRSAIEAVQRQPGYFLPGDRLTAWVEQMGDVLALETAAEAALAEALDAAAEAAVEKHKTAQTRPGLETVTISTDAGPVTVDAIVTCGVWALHQGPFDIISVTHMPTGGRVFKGAPADSLAAFVYLENAHRHFQSDVEFGTAFASDENGAVGDGIRLAVGAVQMRRRTSSMRMAREAREAADLRLTAAMIEFTAAQKHRTAVSAQND